MSSPTARKAATTARKSTAVRRRSTTAATRTTGEVLQIGKRAIPLSDVGQVLYPAARFTKSEAIGFYLGIAPYLLPHLKHRPVALKRYPEGIHGESFWEKDAPSFTPDWVETFPVPRRNRADPPIRYIVVDDRATLAWLASVNSLEIHPFLHRVPAIDVPTSVVFDLDPGEGSDVLTAARVAFLLKDVLDRLQLESFAKVSGSKGIQVYVPLNTPTAYDVTQAFARSVAEFLARAHPDLVVAEMARSQRAGKVFIDWSQNADFKTTVAVYSLRAKRHRPYVSMPVRWPELQRALDRGDAQSLSFDPVGALERLAKVGDLFAPVLELEQTLPEAFEPAPSRRARSPKSTPQPQRQPKSLETYADMRTFERTPEPPPAPVVPRRSRQGSRRRFVVQKHAASHLHYDFRIESQDVLHSWSVPKGVPYALDERRLAVATEDHPLEYLTFEGVIPQGQYGGGTVMVWDIGTCEVIEGNYWKGKLHLSLQGAKLKGEWMLERDPERGDKAWSLVKVGRAMPRISASRDDRSALSGRTMAEITAAKDATWHSNRAAQTEPEASVSKRRTPGSEARGSARERRTTAAEAASRSGRRTPASATGRSRGGDARASVLRFVEPMQCRLVARLPEGDGWQYEIKFDGYRALALRDGDDDTRLLSRRGNDLAARFPRVADAIRSLPERTLVDGEIVALDDDGRPSFRLLHRAKTAAERIFYYVFDIVTYAGRDVARLPLRERRPLLDAAVAGIGDPVRNTGPLDAPTRRLIAAARDFGFEGIVGKRIDSIYEPGKRSGAWIKCRVSPGQELVVGGYLPNGATFDALLVGYYDGKRLVFVAKIRNGFVGDTRRRVLEAMRPLETERCPFANLPEPKNARRGMALTAEVMQRCVWLRPKLVAQIEFVEWTDADHLRHARFIALRDDKDATEVTRESVA